MPNASAAKMRPGGDPNLRIKTWHLAEGVETRVRDWFAGRILKFWKSGARSVYLDPPSDTGIRLKIKGAGLNGGKIAFGEYLRAGPISPIFDFDGRMSEDIATGHDGAFRGGASSQQVVTEWRITKELERLGHAVVPCLGYGSVSDGHHTSWFAVFEVDNTWRDEISPPHGTQDDFKALSIYKGRIGLDLLVKHGLVGFFAAIRDANGRAIIKDVHPFRRTDPFNMSQLSWAMHALFAFHVTAYNTQALCQHFYKEDAPEDSALWGLRAVLPEVTMEDWQTFRFNILTKYMLDRPDDFSSDALQDLLPANPLSRRMLELCPPEFARLR